MRRKDIKDVNQRKIDQALAEGKRTKGIKYLLTEKKNNAIMRFSVLNLKNENEIPTGNIVQYIYYRFYSLPI